jgi:small-conductance mechanosensitive channel
MSMIESVLKNPNAPADRHQSIEQLVTLFDSIERQTWAAKAGKDATPQTKDEYQQIKMARDVMASEIRRAVDQLPKEDASPSKGWFRGITSRLHTKPTDSSAPSGPQAAPHGAAPPASGQMSFDDARVMLDVLKEGVDANPTSPAERQQLTQQLMTLYESIEQLALRPDRLATQEAKDNYQQVLTVRRAMVDEIKGAMDQLRNPR